MPTMLAGLAGCASRPFVADNLYDEARPRAPLAADADAIFARPPWRLLRGSVGKVREQPEAGLRLPDAAASFVLGEVAVYSADGSDVQLQYVSAPGEPPQARVVVRVSVYRARRDLRTEWDWLARRWHERQAGELTLPLPLADAYPGGSERMAWTLPVGDGYGGPAFEEVVLFQRGNWFVRYDIACAAEARAAALPRMHAFLRWIELPIG